MTRKKAATTGKGKLKKLKLKKETLKDLDAKSGRKIKGGQVATYDPGCSAVTCATACGQKVCATNLLCPPVTEGCQTLVNCLPTFYGCAIRRG